MKKNSLDAKNQMLTVTDAMGVKRQVQITRTCAELYQSALGQTKYIANYGDLPHKQLTTDLRDSEYLIKVSMRDFIANRSMITEMDSVILRTIYMRLRRLADFFSTPELTYLTTGKLELKQLAHA
ncbi:hypothetical protein M5X11_31100 [Paenibacillus alginolyticus]|uniref:Uncharacterized protein n=1 Tax=Paenibacillus alginolyticus TaxID=59839 RepID=A0ABT4GBU4_9BACL|nr:hypothetical protein [Paenibacillus alginolyticus]MCY9669320.1 hypothetical protein [Paenibacillus alginolyticus]MCY9693665.1 hypothetical protein [Paenibacillus alginolyticus]MEC0145606.1 hypothetical protein [Paenibacillus alginolyticus]